MIGKENKKKRNMETSRTSFVLFINLPEALLINQKSNTLICPYVALYVMKGIVVMMFKI